MTPQIAAILRRLAERRRAKIRAEAHIDQAQQGSQGSQKHDHDNTNVERRQQHGHDQHSQMR